MVVVDAEQGHDRADVMDVGTFAGQPSVLGCLIGGFGLRQPGAGEFVHDADLRGGHAGEASGLQMVVDSILAGCADNEAGVVLRRRRGIDELSGLVEGEVVRMGVLVRAMLQAGVQRVGALRARMRIAVVGGRVLGIVQGSGIEGRIGHGETPEEVMRGFCERTGVPPIQ